MGVYKYSKSLANASGLASKVKPEPWLHAAIEVYQEGTYIAVFVWDTRQVVYSEFEPFKDYNAYRRFAEDFYRRKYAKAIDNGTKLNWGKFKPLSAINDILYK